MRDGHTLVKDLHGGGYHGGWGSASRMRIYEELANAGMLTAEEKARVKEIVHQSLDGRFIEFETIRHQDAKNNSYGNVGGLVIALRLFPDVAQAEEARAWIDRIWRHFLDFGDWREWTYYPYGPIFLHGLIDLAEESLEILGITLFLRALLMYMAGSSHRIEVTT